MLDNGEIVKYDATSNILRVVDYIHHNGWNLQTNGFNKAMVLKQAYTEVFKIGNTDNDPFDLVSVRPADGFQELNPTYKIIEDFARYDIKKYYGIDLDKFVELPRHITAHMLDIAQKRQNKEADAANNLNNEIKGNVRDQERALQNVPNGFPRL